MFLRLIFDSYKRQKACVAWDVLDLSISYLKMELSKAGLDITFNAKKNIYIKSGSKINIDKYVSINGFPVQWSESVRHLGILLDTTMSDSLDCRYIRCLLHILINL